MSSSSDGDGYEDFVTVYDNTFSTSAFDLLHEAVLEHDERCNDGSNTRSLLYSTHIFMSIPPPVNIIVGGNKREAVISIVGRIVHPFLQSILHANPTLFSPFGAKT